jgi:hypothetical protein
VCRPRTDTGPNWSCDKLRRYTVGTSTNCTRFNQYKLGLEGLSDASPYFQQPRFTNTDAISAAYLQKDIMYIFGERDSCNCNTEGFINPLFCFRDASGSSLYYSWGGDPPATPFSCSPTSNSAGPTCRDMPNGQLSNSFVAVNCGDMFQVRWGGGEWNTQVKPAYVST